jgi:RNA polymerase sigma factor (sigma-70 family)
MPIDRSPQEFFGTSPRFPSTDEQLLVTRAGHGDETALRALMDRYDRLVRYTIFRTAREQTARDPQWLDAVASETWGGFLKSAQRGAGIKTGSVGAYLAGIARQQTISALRRLLAFARQQQSTSELDALSHVASTDIDPETLIADLESLTMLRDCAAHLPEDEKLIMTQLEAITGRQWVKAGETLGLSESTLRSKWGKIVDRLRSCMEKKQK